MTLFWWRITKKRLAKTAVPPVWSRAIHFQSPHLREQLKTRLLKSSHRTYYHNLLPPPLIAPSLPVSHYITTQLSTLSVEVITKQQRPYSPFTPLPSHYISSRVTSRQRDSTLYEEEWEAPRIVDKKRRGKDNTYKVYWKITLLFT